MNTAHWTPVGLFLDSGSIPGRNQRLCTEESVDWLQVDELAAEDFARAGRGIWLDAAVFILVGLASSCVGFLKTYLTQMALLRAPASWSVAVQA